MPSDIFRTARNVVSDLRCYIVLTTRSRTDVMTERVQADLRFSFEEVCSRNGATLESFTVDRGHALLQVSYPPKIALSTLIMSLKTISSMRVRKHRWEEIDQALMGDAFWSPSYAVASYGQDPLDVVAEYIRTEQAPSRGRGRPPRTQV